MATKATPSLPGGTSLSGKKIVVTSYSGVIDLSTGEFSTLGATAIDASAATSNTTLKGGAKATSFITSKTSGTVVEGGKAADKITLGAGADTVNFSVGGAGNDQITGYDGTNDIVVIQGKNRADAAFADSGSKVTVTFAGSKEKLVINKGKAADKVRFRFDDGEFAYGDLSNGLSLDNKKKTLTVSASASGTVEAADVASTIKDIAAANNSNSLYIVGNNQANNITIGAAGGTLDGGHAVDAAKGAKGTKATADKLYGGNGADTFVWAGTALAGSDQINNYNGAQDVIKITGKTSTEIAAAIADTKSFKDSGKNAVLTLDKQKLTINGTDTKVTPSKIVFVGSDNARVVYGLESSLLNNAEATFDSKKSALSLSGGSGNLTLSLDDARLAETTVIGGVTYANANLAPKLKTIDASKYDGAVVLGSLTSSVAGNYIASDQGSTLLSGSGNDAFTGGKDKDVFTFDLSNTKGIGKNKISGFGSVDDDGDYIKLNGYDSSVHVVTVAAKGTGAKASATVTITNASTRKSLGTIEIASTTGKTVAVTDEKGNILALSPATEPEGLTYDAKKGISTDKNFTGAYKSGLYVPGDNVTIDPDHTNQPNITTIDAADYNTKTTVVDASLVSGDVTQLLLVGNSDVKNVITAPNEKSLLNDGTDDNGNALVELSTTLKGGVSQADILNGSTLNGAIDHFYFAPATKNKKDTVNNYGENDWIVIQSDKITQADLTALKNGNTASSIKLEDSKNEDAVLTFDKTTATVKDASGKKLNIKIVDENGKQTASIAAGHTLPAGLEYDAKKTLISVTKDAAAAASLVGSNPDEGNYSNSVNINLNDTLTYFDSVKNVSLSAISTTPAGSDDDPQGFMNTTLIGNDLANELRAGGNKYSTSFLYGGEGTGADKLFGGAGTDYFVYAEGDGKDAVGDTKGGQYAAGDYVILAGGDNAASLLADRLYITDTKGGVVNLQIGTDTKKGTLTVTKDDADTPINFVLVKDTDTARSLASALATVEGGIDGLDGAMKSGSAKWKAGTDFYAYTYGLDNPTLSAKLNTNGNLDVTGINYAVATLEGYDFSMSESDTTYFTADLNTKQISSTIKNINVTAGDKLSVNIVGNGNANSITLGAGGGTVDGGYSVDTKGKVKATADKLYGGNGADTFVYHATEGSENVGGKDIIYNYDPANDVIYVDAVSAISAVKYSDKSVAFTFGNNQNVLTLQGIKGSTSFPDDTWVTFYDASTKKTVTYTGFDKKANSLSDLAQVATPWTAYTSENKAWTLSSSEGEDNYNDVSSWVYKANEWTANGINFTLGGDFNHDSIGYADINGGVRPTGVSIDEPGGKVITVDTVVQTVQSGDSVVNRTVPVANLSNFTFAHASVSGADGVHIKGITPAYTNGKYSEDQTVQAGTGTSGANGSYRLANLDGDSTNGLELVKVNESWAMNSADNWVYGGNSALFTIVSGSPLNVNATVGAPSDISVKAGAGEDGASITVSGGIAASQLNFDQDAATGAKGVHIIGYDTDTKITINHIQSPGAGAEENAQPTITPYNYVLAQLDGDTKNGLELLRANDNWTLTEEGWKFASDTTKFTVNLTPTNVSGKGSLKAADDNTNSTDTSANGSGAPAGITVSFHPSVDANGEEVKQTVNDEEVTVPNKNAGMIIDFSEATNVVTSLVSFDGGTTTNIDGVHIKGLSEHGKYSSEVTLGGAAYRLVELNGDNIDGRELVKRIDNWTPIYAANSDSQSSWRYSVAGGVNFTVDTDYTVLFPESQRTEDNYTTTKLISIGDDGAVEDITVDGDKITFGSKFSSLQTVPGEYDGENPPKTFRGYELGNITFASTTTVGASGIHIAGYAPTFDTLTGVYDENQTVKLAPRTSGGAATDYRLANLDGDSTNGLELMSATNTSWKYNKDDNWIYASDSKDLFTIVSDGESPISVNATLGAPALVSLKTASSGSAHTLSIAGGVDASMVRFNGETNGASTGANGIHIIGFDIGTKFNSYTVTEGDDENAAPTINMTEYVLANLDADTKNGYELLKTGSDWSLAADGWHYTNGSTGFNIALVPTTLPAAADDPSKPAGVEISYHPSLDGEGHVVTQEVQVGEETKNETIWATAEGTMIDFSGLAGENSAAKSAKASVVSFNAGTPTNVNGVHITGLDKLDKYSSSVSVGSSAYWLVELNDATVPGGEGESGISDGLELAKKNDKWAPVYNDGTESETDKSLQKGWRYSVAGGVNFTVGTQYDVLLPEDQRVGETYTQKKYVEVDDDGAVVDITVDGNKITFGSKFASLQTYGEGDGAKSFHGMDYENITFASTTTVGKNGVHIAGYNPTFDMTGVYEDDQLVKVATKVKGTLDEYRLANLDGDSTNGYELLAPNDNWRYDINDNWIYKNGDNDLFTIVSGSSNPIDVNATLGAPVLVSVISDGAAPTISVGSGLNANTIMLSDDLTKNKDGAKIKGLDIGTTIYSYEEEQVTDSNGEAVNGDDGEPLTEFVPTRYVVANLDGATANGNELLKVNDNWTLQSDGWHFSQDSTSFVVKLQPTVTGMKPTDDEGKPESISTAYYPSVNSGSEVVTGDDGSVVFDPSKGMLIDFTGVAATSKASVVSFNNGTPTNADGVHITGLDKLANYSSQVSVGNAAYWLVELNDGKKYTKTGDTYTESDNTDGLELAKVNSNWKPVYDTENATQESWAYSVAGGAAFTIDARYDAVKTNDGEKQKDANKLVSVDDNGAVEGITVSGNNITFGAKFSSVQALSDDENATTVRGMELSKVTFASTTAVGRSGLHINGYESDTVINIDIKSGTSKVNTAYQLVELDGNTSNGYELMKVDTVTGAGNNGYRGWVYKDGAWDFASDTVKIKFRAEGGIAPSETGKPVGVSYSIKGGSDDNATITFGLSGSNLTDALNAMSFADTVEGNKPIYGAEGIHFKGVAADTQVSIRAYNYTEPAEGTSAEEVAEHIRTNTTMYQMVELDGSTVNGYEMMKVDDQWSLKGGAWSYSNVQYGEDGKVSTESPVTIAFDIKAAASIKAADDGKPVSETLSYDSNTKTFTLPQNFLTNNLSITTFDSVVGDNDSVDYGASGVHFKLTAPTGDKSSVSGALYSDTKLNIGGTSYQLVNLDETDATYELMKVDSKWSLEDGAWTYNGDIKFSIDKAAGVKANDDGTPQNISVTGSTIDLSEYGAENTSTLLSNLALTTATAGTASNAIRFIGVTEGNADITIGTKTQKYQLVQLDSNENNGVELMQVNATTLKAASGNDAEVYNGWKYNPTSKVWNYEYATASVKGTGANATTETTETLVFELKATDAITPTASGVPSGVTVTGGSKITLPADFELTNLTVSKMNFDVDTPKDALHIYIPNAEEGNLKVTIGSGENTTEYALYNADGNASNGFELTHDGWLSTTVTVSGSGTNAETAQLFRYKSNKYEYIVSGGAFGTYTKEGKATKYAESQTTPTGVTIGEDGISFDNTVDLSLDKFHIKGTNAPSNGTLTINNTAFTLKNVDDNTANGYELTNNNWARSSTATASTYQYVHTTDKFTVSGADDANTDLIPDAFTYASKTFTFESAPASGLSVTFSSTSAASSYKVSVTSGKDTYKLTQSDSTTTYTFTKVEEQGQLAATGYDVEDLFNYDSSSTDAIGGGDLDEILDVKPLASAEPELGLAAINGIDLGINAASTLGDLTKAARHQKRK